MWVFYCASDLQILWCGWTIRSGSEDPPAAVGHCRPGEVCCRSFFPPFLVLLSPFDVQIFLPCRVSHPRRQVSESNDGVLQRRHGLPPPVRPHKRTELPQRQKLDEYVTP